MAAQSQLEKAVAAALRFEPALAAAPIVVAVEDDVVTLTGYVPTYAQKLCAETAVRAVRGVQSVVDEIEVRLPEASRRTDGEIALAAKHRLAWNVSLMRERIEVAVAKGWVTLSGDVDWHYQREAAKEDLRRVVGVVGISNLIAIRPVVDAVGMEESIMQAIHRLWYFDDNAVRVTARGGVVRLSGEVTTPHARQLAASMAWAARGVTEVENDIVIV